MHKFTVSDVMIDGFDLSQLKVSANFKSKMVERIEKVRDTLINKKKVATKNNYAWVSDSEVFATGFDFNESVCLALLFDNEFAQAISKAATNYYNNYYNASVSYFLISTVIKNFIANNLLLSTKFMLWPQTAQEIKNYSLTNSLLSQSLLISYVRSGEALKLSANIQFQLLEISSPEEAKIFVKSDSEKIRLAAYKKLGPIQHLDEMIKDPDCFVRKYAIRIMEPQDPRIATFIDDRSTDVYATALQKIHSDLLPMMFGSKHLKKERVKSILTERIEFSKKD